MRAGLNAATSRKISVVLSETSLPLPPITIDAIERLDQLFAARFSHHHGAAGELLQIERVHRLAEAEEHVVSGVDDVVDRARTDRLQSAYQPVRTRSDLQPRDHCARVSHAAIGVL